MDIFTFATLARRLTGAPGGVGGAEAAMVALPSLEGVPLEGSIPATAVIRLTTLWFAIAIGLAVFPLAERRAARAQGWSTVQGARQITYSGWGRVHRATGPVARPHAAAAIDGTAPAFGNRRS